jgi:hypothetical protein
MERKQSGMSSSTKKIIVSTAVTALCNCLIGHLVEWCLFEMLGLNCPHGKS